jgi:hypothetical protein
VEAAKRKSYSLPALKTLDTKDSLLELFEKEMLPGRWPGAFERRFDATGRSSPPEREVDCGCELEKAT